MGFFPPTQSEEHILSLISQIKDWQINHGSLLKLIRAETEHSSLCRPVGVSVFPTPFPRTHFHRALELQTIYNELYCAIAEDEEWISETIKDLIPVEPLVAILWEIYQEVRRDIRNGVDINNVSAGIFRSDYMLSLGTQGRRTRTSGGDENGNQNQGVLLLSETRLKQVEFNTFSCAGGAHAKRVVDMHRYLARRGDYSDLHGDSDNRSNDSPINITAESLPRSDNVEALASCLRTAHAVYGAPKGSAADKTAVLFVVQPHNYNIADERPIEYALWNPTDGKDDDNGVIPTYRVEFGHDVLHDTILTESRELLFHPGPRRKKNQKPVEISVIYMRAGYEAGEYSPAAGGREARLRLEKSRCIKCPSLLTHIATFKRVQQALTAPGALERFLPPEKVEVIRDTFVPIYPLDNESEAGRYARSLVESYYCSSTSTESTSDTNDGSGDETCHREEIAPRNFNYVLKPSREGGGHNVFGNAIPEFLASIPESEWSSYILMERIRAPPVTNVLISPDQRIRMGEVVSELGVFGACLWRSSSSGSSSTSAPDGGCEMLQNAVAGWSFKTKSASTDEMSVVKGYGCFDTPCLVDID